MRQTRSQRTAMHDDAELMRRAKRGDVKAFAVLVERYKDRAYMIALGIVGVPEEAMDVSQDAFVSAWRSARTFKDERDFYPWFYAILRNKCFNSLRRTRTRRESSLDAARDAGFDVADRSPDPAAAAERSELRVVVMRELHRLNPAHREIIMLRHFEELTYKEIAAVLGCPIGTVMSRLSAARRALRVRLEPVLKESPSRIPPPPRPRGRTRRGWKGDARGGGT